MSMPMMILPWIISLMMIIRVRTISFLEMKIWKKRKKRTKISYPLGSSVDWLWTTISPSMFTNTIWTFLRHHHLHQRLLCPLLHHHLHPRREKRRHRIDQSHPRKTSSNRLCVRRTHKVRSRQSASRRTQPSRQKICLLHEHRRIPSPRIRGPKCFYSLKVTKNPPRVGTMNKRQYFRLLRKNQSGRGRRGQSFLQIQFKGILRSAILPRNHPRDKTCRLKKSQK